MGVPGGEARRDRQARALGSMGSLTGARVVLEGAHAVSVGRERAHALAGVCQPALDRPVGAARVHVPVYQLRAGGGGKVGTGHSGPAQKPLQTSVCKQGGARAGLSGETVDEPEMPLPGGPTRSPTLVPEVMLPTSHLLCRAVGVRRACRHQTDPAAEPHWPLAKSLTLLSAASPTVRTTPAPSSWGSDPTTQHSAP